MKLSKEWNRIAVLVATSIATNNTEPTPENISAEFVLVMNKQMAISKELLTDSKKMDAFKLFMLDILKSR